MLMWFASRQGAAIYEYRGAGISPAAGVAGSGDGRMSITPKHDDTPRRGWWSPPLGANKLGF
jgi:hypothetical protein